VDFRVPQQELSRVTPGLILRVSTDAFPDQSFEGKVTAIDPLVDSTSRNFQVEASVNNSSRKLLPGMFAKVAVQTGTVQRRLTVPQAAITYNPYGATVFVALKSKDGQSVEAQQVFVTVGATRGDQAAITTGLKEGDVIVTSGQLKLKNGTVLKVDNSVQPKNDPHPTPQEE